MRRFVKLGLFLGSYAPLFVLLALLEWKNKLLGEFMIFSLTINWLAFLFIVSAIAGIAIVLVFLKIAKNLAPSFVTIKKLPGGSQDTVAYLITYLVPFIGFKFTDLNGAVANAIIFLMIGFLYVQSNMVYLNPVLSLMGYKINKVSVDGVEKLMLAKADIKDQTRVKVVAISRGVYIHAEK